jgi:phage I-like protein
MPNFLTYDIAHDIVHSDNGGTSSGCPLCNGTASKEQAQELAGQCITRRHNANMAHTMPMYYTDKNGKKVKGGAQFCIDVKKFGEDGKLPEWIQLIPLGKFNTVKYGEFEITKNDLVQMKKNFETGELRAGVPIDIDHRDSPKYGSDAAGWVRETKIKDDGLWGRVEWNKLGEELLTNDIYKFLSPEFAPVYEDPLDADKFVSNVLLAASLVNQPLFRNLKPLRASEDTDLTQDKNHTMILFTGSSVTNNSTNQPMPNLKDLLESNKTFAQLSKEEQDFIKANESFLSDDTKTKLGLIKADDKKDDDDKDKKDTKVEGAETVTISASELAELRKGAQGGSEARKMLEKKEVEGEVTSLFFSEGGIKLKTDKKEAAVDFMLTLTVDQRKQFSEIVEAIPAAQIFGEIGHDKNTTAAGDLQKQLNEKATKYFNENKDKGVTYRQATEHVVANDPLFNNYSETAPSIR